MKHLAPLAALALAACVSAPAGFDTAQWRKDFKACQVAADADSARLATHDQKMIAAAVSGYALSSAQADNPATDRWKNRRTDECLVAKGYPSDTTLSR